MGESRTGFWATIALLLVVSIVFIVLWFMRGGEIDTLKQTLGQEQRFRSDDVSRLESNLSSLQYDFDSTKRRLDETTSQLDSERMRANQARQEADRLSREQLGQTGSAARLADEISALKESLAKEQTAKAELENRAATAEAALIAARKGLEEELTDLRTDVQIKRGAIENLVRKVAELEGQVKTASAAAASGDESGLIAQLRSQLEEMTSNNTSLAAKLEATGKQVEAITSERDKLVADLKASSQNLDEIRSQMGSQAQAAAAAGSAESERIAALTQQLAERTAAATAAGSAESERIAALTQQLAERTAAASAGAERIAALTRQLEERSAAAEVAGRRIEELEKYLEEANRAAADNSAAEQISALTQQVKEQEAAADRSRAEAEAADRRLEEMETRIEYSNHLEDTLTKLNEEMAVIRADRDNSVEAMSKLQAEYDKQLAAEKQKVAAFADRISAYQGKADVLEGRLGEMTSMVEEYKQVYGQAAPVRQVAEVVDAMYSNKTVVINIGGNQRVKPGMKFDVYRPVGDRNRYLGMVHVVKVSADTALAVSSFRAERVMVCPVTGFAVLEPGARFSPFAKGKDGSPVELVEMDSLNIPVEAPGIGDILASPFYSPEKAFSFAVQDPAAFAYGEAQVIVDTLGGIYRPWQTKDAVDFAIISGDKADTGNLKGNAVAVTADYVKRYYQPLVVETSSMPCVVCP